MADGPKRAQKPKRSLKTESARRWSVTPSAANDGGDAAAMMAALAEVDAGDETVDDETVDDETKARIALRGGPVSTCC